VHIDRVGEDLFLIDLETGGFEGIAASYVLRGLKSIIVETGPTSSILNLISGLKKIGISTEDVAYVAVTHVHVDHSGGVGKLLKFLPNAKVVVHPNGVKHMISPERLWQQTRIVLGEIADVYGKPEPVPTEKLISAVDRMVLDVGGGTELRVVETLGHAAHHLSFYSQKHRGVFVGDAAGIYLSEVDAVIPTTPPPFRLEMTLESLEKLGCLRPELLYYSHFGVADDAENRLRSYMAQLGVWAKIVREGIEKGESVEEITRRILMEDKMMNRIMPYVEANEILMKAGVGNSVQGLVDYSIELMRKS
jgi:glyoxylase-like metal-dependent hydrolase (beta-lactamase superfamily II)